MEAIEADGRERKEGMTIIVTAKELMTKGVWGEACEILGIYPYVVNEGFMDPEYELTFTENEARQIGLIK